jgi:hypothetical protein
MIKDLGGRTGSKTDHRVFDSSNFEVTEASPCLEP